MFDTEGDLQTGVQTDNGIDSQSDTETDSQTETETDSQITDADKACRSSEISVDLILIIVFLQTYSYFCCILTSFFYVVVLTFKKFIYIYVVEWSRALDVRLSEWCCSVSMVWVQILSREKQKFDSSKI